MKKPLICLLVALIAGSQLLAADLTVDQALGMINDDKVGRNRKKWPQVVETFSKLDENGKKRAAEKLAPLIGRCPFQCRLLLYKCIQTISPYGLDAIMKRFDDNTTERDYRYCLSSQGPEVINRLLPKLDDKNSDIKVKAASLLCEFIRRNNYIVLKNFPTTKLIPYLDDNDPDFLAQIANACGALKNKALATVPALVKLLANPSAKVKNCTVRALAAIRPDSTDAQKALLKVALDRKNKPGLRNNAVNAFILVSISKPEQDKVTKGDKRLHPKVDKIVTALAANFDVDNVTLSVNTAKQIASHLGGMAIPALVKLLSDSAPAKKRFALFALAKIGKKDEAAGKACLKLLNDRAPYVRRNAIEALGIVGKADVAASLLPMLQDQDIGVKLTARNALRNIAADDAKVKDALRKLDEQLASRNVSKPDPSPGTDAKPEDYCVGGPLAGLKLPLYPSQQGGEPGYPGCVPALAEKALKEHEEAMKKDANLKPYTSLNKPFTKVGQFPENDLYPGSVEHWRAYMFKYMPIRSNFDRQSQIKNWVAPNIPGVRKSQIGTYAAPISWVPRWGHRTMTGLKQKAVPVVSLNAGDSPIKLNCGKLQRGVYVIRLIAAVPTEKIKYFRENLFNKMTVNDGVKGEVSTYLKRAPYTDEFYSMCEMFFHAPESRDYTAEISVAKGSEVTLLIHNISLDDALTGSVRKAIKTSVNLKVNKTKWAELEQKRLNPKPIREGNLLAEERDIRNQWLWQMFPPPNSQGNRPYRFPRGLTMGTPTMDLRQVANTYGTWEHGMFFRSQFARTPQDPSVFLRNQKLGLTYSIDDMKNNKPLPDPYPFKDNGTALTYPDPNTPKAGKWFCPIAQQVQSFYWNYPTTIHKSVGQWLKTGNDYYADDAAIALIRWAYAFPLLQTQSAYLHNNIAEYGQLARNARFRKRMTTSGFYRWYTQYAEEELDDYEILYPYIENNWELVESVKKYVPCVKTPRDIIKLIDTYLVQSTAKRILRYQWHTGEMKPARLASVLGDNSFTKPWMDFLFARTFVYPLPIAGLDDLMISGTTREGTEYVASTMYAGGENAIPKASALISYLEAGGDRQFDLSDPKRYPKPLDTCYWMMERMVAGLNFIRIADVCGPDKFYGGCWKNMDTASYWGWRWSKDPIFAFFRVHYFGKRDFTDEQWQEIQQAAKKVTRPPWLDMPSRVLPNWAAILESGRQYDDHRFRRAVAVRTGLGWGHHHNDSLDLQVYAHGSMATCDGGQRPSYSKPADRSTFMHNLVEVNGGVPEKTGEWLGYSWTRSLSDVDGVKYMQNESVPPKTHQDVKIYRRQDALIDVDEGKGSQSLTAEQSIPGAELPKNVVTPNSYVFDVVRVSGGKRHTYCFHGNLSDKVTQNMKNPVPMEKAGPKDQKYTDKMGGEKLAGDAPEHLQVTFQTKASQSERDLGKNFNKAAGAYFTRLHLLGAKDARVLRGALNCVKWKYLIPMVFVQKRGKNEDNPDVEGDMESVFTAVIEPYVKNPFIKNIKSLSIANNDKGALRAVAIEIETTNGHKDICFADGYPNKVRSFDGKEVGAEFAYFSSDAKGLRLVSVTGGSFLKSDTLLFQPSASHYTGKVVSVDYANKTMVIDRVWPKIDGRKRPFTMEVGSAKRVTTYTAREVLPGQDKTTIKVKGGADFYQSRVTTVDPKTHTVYCTLTAGTGVEGYEPTPGLDKNWVASNGEMTKFWRAEYQAGDRDSGRIAFKLNDKVSLEDFSKTWKFRLWEYGVGDVVRHLTVAGIKRVSDNVYQIETDVDVTVGFKANVLEFSVDGKTWKSLKTQKMTGFTTALIKLGQLSDQGKGYIRVK